MNKQLIYTCMSKKVFSSYESAKRAAKRRDQVYKKKTRSYKCDNCQLWHHTTRELEKP